MNLPQSLAQLEAVFGKQLQAHGTGALDPEFVKGLEELAKPRKNP